MSYAPKSLSFGDGLERGAQSERARISALIMDKHYRNIDIYDTATLANFTDLLEAITNPEQEQDNEN